MKIKLSAPAARLLAELKTPVLNADVFDDDGFDFGHERLAMLSTGEKTIVEFAKDLNGHGDIVSTFGSVSPSLQTAMISTLGETLGLVDGQTRRETLRRALEDIG